jgi:hypothetical protein
MLQHIAAQTMPPSASEQPTHEWRESRGQRQMAARLTILESSEILCLNIDLLTRTPRKLRH